MKAVLQIASNESLVRGRHRRAPIETQHGVRLVFISCEQFSMQVDSAPKVRRETKYRGDGRRRGVFGAGCVSLCVSIRDICHRSHADEFGLLMATWSIAVMAETGNLYRLGQIYQHAVTSELVLARQALHLDPAQEQSMWI